MKIVIVCGTNRRGALSRQLAAKLESVYRELGVETHLLDLLDLPAAVIQPEAYREKPPEFVRGFIEPVLAADGLHVVVPEYNGSVPGVLKLFVDLLPFPEAFERRPAAYTGIAAGQFGALRAVEQIQLVFGYRNALNFPERVFLANSYQVFDDAGEFRDPALAARLRRQAVGFQAFVEAVAPIRQRPPLEA